jgi:hypothetical protein
LRCIGQRAAPCFDRIGEKPVIGQRPQRMAVVYAGAVLGFGGELDVPYNVVEIGFEPYGTAAGAAGDLDYGFGRTGYNAAQAIIGGRGERRAVRGGSRPPPACRS